MERAKNISVAVLAGGKSSRMGQDKGLLPLGGRKMIEHVLNTAQTITPNVLIVANNEEYVNFSYRCFPDEIADCGPMGAIFTALQKAGTDKVLVLCCDAPLISTDVLRALVENSGRENVLAAVHNGELQPLCAIYDKSCLGYFKNAISASHLKMKTALQELKAKTLAFDGEMYREAFLNVNTPADLVQIKKLFDEK